MIQRSIRTFWYKGSAESKEKGQVRKIDMFFKNSCLDSKANFSKKLMLCMWFIISGVDDVVLHIVSNI